MMTEIDLKTTGTIELWCLQSFASPADLEQINAELEERRRELRFLRSGYAEEVLEPSDYNPGQMVLAEYVSAGGVA